MSLKEIRHTIPERLAKHNVKVEIGDSVYQELVNLLEDYKNFALDNYKEIMSGQTKNIKELKEKIAKLTQAKTTQNTTKSQDLNKDYYWKNDHKKDKIKVAHYS